LDALIAAAARRGKRNTTAAVRRERLQAVGRATRSGTWRWRYQTAPLTAICATWLTGSLLRFAPHGGRLVVAAVVLGGAVWWFFSRKWLDRRIERIYATACLAGVAAWLFAATTVGVGWNTSVGRPLVPVLWVLGVLAAMPWWQHFRVRPPTAGAPADTTLATLWAERVAESGRALPGSRLVNVHPVKNGVEAEIVLQPGVHVTANAIAATQKVTSAFEETEGSVAIESSRSYRANRARLLIVRNNPLHQPILWPGPHLLDAATGLAPIGIYADEEPVPYRFFRPGSGPQHDLISGSTDAGKSRLIDQLLAYERHSGFMVSLVIDPQRGQSVPDWKHNVQAFAGGTLDGLALLRRVEVEMYARNEMLSEVAWDEVARDGRRRQRRGVDHFDPAHPAVVRLGLKMWVLTIEEAQDLLKIPEAADIVQRLVAMARKCGIKVRLVTQVPLLSSLGGRMEIRDAVASGNVFVLRTANGLSGQVAFNGTIPVQPHQLPRQWPNGLTTSGIGYTLGAATRSAMMRCHFVEDPFHWATTGGPAELAWLPPARSSVPPTPAAPAVVSVDVKAEPQDAGCRAAVLAALGKGMRKRGDIIAAAGYSVSAVQKELSALVAEGLARKDGHGEYVLAEDPAAVQG
jgi:hypothetical protein